MKNLLLILLAAAVSCGCMDAPIIKYREWDPNKPFIMNAWYKADDTYFFQTPSEYVAKGEFERITQHKVDTIPFNRYGFYLWSDGHGMYYLTQNKR